MALGLLKVVAPRPIPDEAALLVGDVLVIADLHLGREFELQEKGLFLPSQALAMADRVASLLEATGANRLVILGDLKHRLSRASGLERRDLPLFFQRILPTVREVHLVKGNHDAGIEYHIPPSVKLHGPGGLVLGGVGMAHGHTWPSAEAMAAEVLVMGHNHPVVAFVDPMGSRTVQRCWARMKFSSTGAGRYKRLPREAIVMPAFNEFSGGTVFNGEEVRYLGPLLNSSLFRMEEARLYLLNGTYLGRVGELKALADGFPKGARRGRKGGTGQRASAGPRRGGTHRKA
jgi:hypothetical protein